MTGARSPVLLLAPLALLLGGCEDDPAPKAPGPRAELTELVRSAEIKASRAEGILGRVWAQRLAFRERLYTRLQALRSYVQEGSQALSANAQPFDRLVERGRALVDKSERFEQATALIEKVVPTLDGITGCENLIEVHLKPLESRGEAPFRMRFVDLEKQVKLGMTHLDEALARILDGAADAATHQGIAINNLAQAYTTATRLTEEVKQIAILAGAATGRQAMLSKRIQWAESVLAKAGKDAVKGGADALEKARAFARDLPPRTDAVLDTLRNSQPDAAAKAKELAATVDDEIERLTRTFLDAGRKAGVPDPE
jgi:hypothetical protein